LIDRINQGRKNVKGQTVSVERQGSQPQGLKVTGEKTNKKDNTGLVRNKTETNFRVLSTKLPEIALKSSRDSKFRKEGIGALMRPLGSNRDKN